jgi:excisionase family DNA binding protein
MADVSADGNETVITFQEAAGLLKVSHYTVRRMAAEGELPLIRVRRTTRTTLEGVRAYIDRSRTPAAAAV